MTKCILTAAERVQQALSGPTPLADSLTVPEAVARLSSAAHRLETALLREGLTAIDGRIGLLFSNATEAGEELGVFWTRGEKVGHVLTKLEAMESVRPVGLVYGVADHEVNMGRLWARPLVSGEDAAARMQMAKEIFKLPAIIR